MNHMNRAAPGHRHCLRLLLAAGVMLLSSACMVGPRYQRASAPTSPAYKEAQPATAQGAVWKQAEPNDGAIREKWWEIYGIPDLNGLEEAVNIGFAGAGSFHDRPTDGLHIRSAHPI
jgi:hypothetical protein